MLTIRQRAQWLCISRKIKELLKILPKEERMFTSIFEWVKVSDLCYWKI